MLFSFIVTCFNAEKTIARCIQSIKNQNYNDFECIIWNDGSYDNTDNVINNLINGDPRFNYFYGKNHGTCYASNNAVSLSSGKYVIFIDHDDWVSSNLLDELKVLINRYKPDLIGFECDYYSWEDNKLIDQGDDSKSIEVAEDFDSICSLSMNSSIVGTHTSSCIKRNLLDNVFFKGNPNGADTAVMRILLQKSTKIVVFRSILYHRYVFDNSLSRRKQKKDMRLSIIENILSNIHFFYCPIHYHSFLLYDCFRWYLWGRNKILRKNPFYIFRFALIGFKIFKHRNIILQKKICA